MLTLPGIISQLILVLALALTMASVSAQQQQRSARVLVYTATRGYRHDSIPTAIEVLGQRGGDYNVSFSFTEDQNQFNNANLATFDGVMFVHNSDQVLDTNGEAALQTFFRSGGVYCGVHAGSACLQNNTNYQQAVGAIFDYHPDLQPATFVKLDGSHPSMTNVPDQWRFTEEVYNFRSDPRSNGATVILTVDETSYTNTSQSTGNYPFQGSPHPIAWYISSPQSAQPLNSGAPKAGRSFYTSLGHLNETWRDGTFQSHVLGGLRWALDGASTRAYGVGLVGNNGTSTTSPSASTGPSGTSSGTGTGSATGSAAASSTSRAAAAPTAGEGGVGKKAVLGAAGVAAGLSLLM